MNMPSIKGTGTLIRAYLLALLIVSLTGCGYSAAIKPPVDTIKIDITRNLTTEPGLQDLFYETLVLELVRNGISIDPSAAYTLVGALKEVKVRNLAMIDHLTVQFEVNINGEFYLLEPGGGKRTLQSSNVFIVSFVKLGSLEGVMSEQERAIRMALKDLSSELADSIMYD